MNETNLIDDMTKLMKVVHSCKTIEQLSASKLMLKNFIKKYDHPDFFPMSMISQNKLFDILKIKERKLSL